MTISEQTLIALNVSLILQLLGLVIALVIDPYINARNKRIMLISVGLIMSLVIQQQAQTFFQENAITVGRTLMSVYGYCVRPLIICMFMQLFGRTRKAWVLIGINTLIYSTSFFSDLTFSYSANNIFRRGPLGFSCHIISAMLLVQLVFLSVRNHRKKNTLFSSFPILIVSLIVLGTLTDTFIFVNYCVDLLTVITVSSCVIYYIWLHLQFVTEHERDLKAEQRIKIMMSQIQPHFLFNTLTTIQTLCTIDPERAADTVQKFGFYLRRNIDSLNSDMLITFEKELEYTKVYSDIEMIRFPNIKLEFDIGDKDFELPALTVQPMVENAISHGVRIREEGRVSVITRKVDGYHEIIIRDNGKGFDVEAALSADKTHIGLRNVRERVETICGGTFSVSSVIGEGSEIVIRIPA